MTSYNKIYLQSVMGSCRYLFKLIARNNLDVFKVIEEYMNSECREKMDKGNPAFLNKTPKQILEWVGYLVEQIEEPSDRIDEFILEWMADMYTYIQWSTAISSKEIVSKIKPEELYLKYSPLHETSTINAAEKLVEIYLTEK